MNTYTNRNTFRIGDRFKCILPSFSIHLLVFCFTFLPLKIAFAQENLLLEKKVQDYMVLQIPSQQYDSILILMDFNAEINLQTADFYFNLFKSDDYQSKNPKYALLAHFIAADVLYYNENKDSSLFHYLSLANKAKIEGEQMLAASGLGNAAYVLAELGDKLGALNLLKQNIEIAGKTGDLRDLSDFNYNIASLYSDVGIRDSAIHYFEKTIDLDRITQNEYGMVYNMHTLLDQYLETNSIEKANQLCNECIATAEKIEDEKAISTCLFYLARTKFLLGEYEEAKSVIEQVLEMEEKRIDVTRKSKHLTLLAEILARKDDSNSASLTFQEAIAAAENSQIQEEIARSKLAFALFLNDAQAYKESLTLLAEIEHELIDSNLPHIQNQVFNAYESIYSKLNDFEQVAYYQNKQISWLDEQLRNEQLLATEQSKNAYDLFKLESTNRLLEAEKQLADAKLKRRNLLVIVSLLTLLLLSGSTYFFTQNQKQKNRIKANQLELQVVEKELSALRSQMNPHFLFNSLNSINDYILHEEPRKASKYLTKFSYLMRTILNNSKEKLITLEEELNANQLYVEMENIRFKDKFEFNIQMDDHIKPQKVLIPAMLIQPYLENAIKHGLRHRRSPGSLAVNLSKKEEQLIIRIVDNGIGRKESARLNQKRKKEHISHGMGITENRINLLNQIHNIDAQLEIVDLIDPTGTEVIIRIKYLPTTHSD